MDSNDSTVTSGSEMANSNEENPRIRLLCSYGGSILPRPHDGKLRYVGGETRIAIVNRDISYEQLMAKMRELFEGATVCKYQQPNEDLDALVSVFNDDDVINMMEEYDKLGPRHAFTKLRIFLFSHFDQDGLLHFSDGDAREIERRYVEALNNNLSDSPEYKNHGDFGLDDIHIGEHYFHHMNHECCLHNQRNAEMQIPHINLHRLNIPRLGLGQQQRYNEMDAQWSPIYYSPRQPGHEPRPVATDVASSPSSSRHYSPYAEAQEKSYDRAPEDYSRLQVNHQPFQEQLPQYADNMLLFPKGHAPSDKASFEGSTHHSPHALEGNFICEHCQLTFQRNQPYPDSPWKPGERQYAESNIGSGLQFGCSPCAEFPPNREMPLRSTNANMHPICYPREQTDPHALSNDTQNNERGWVVQHNNLPNTHHVPPYYVHHDGLHSFQHGQELGNRGFLDHVVDKGSQVLVPPVDECGVRYGNSPRAHGTDPLYQLPHGHIVANSMWGNVHGPMHGGPSYEAFGPTQLANDSSGPTFVRGSVENSPSFKTGLENPNPWVDLSLKKLALDDPSLSECIQGQTLRLTPNVLDQDSQSAYTPEQAESSSEMLNLVASVDSLVKADQALLIDDKVVGSIMTGACTRHSDVDAGDSKALNDIPVEFTMAMYTTKGNSDYVRDSPGFIPDLVASSLNHVIEVRAEVLEDALAVVEDDKTTKLGIGDEPDAVKRVALGGFEMDSDNDNEDNSKIEPTEAEAEAIERGLQTIRNEDLEEIRELGSGTYGAVYHGKWKGSDVAIKRIKASCFAGRPSERKRLIADFWKEALILSSLHHPNVVAFYGVVRDGPDGSLATLTEFMVNGSLKQFLRKKDRTIDRRKRLIIAMDTAFGMEYLHEKNIVHFDLKCENLLVNMRDPHRPVCKIGDLGLSKVKQQTLVSGGVRGTLPWMAPELLSGKSNMVTEKIDVYSFGIVMWELLTGEEPYADMHCASIIGGIVNNTLRPEIPIWCDPEWKSLMESCWASDPSERPSFSEISQKLRSMAAAMNVK
ncbi:unnamed protein product [Cuscuta epithymum]|uniref:Protein kinase domain-containing protein n=1 Tax=Cuscuta epithymum TaxID=186058 RepID=A0AAV0FIH8_9ASTE|nr:unnamed protein product [Cuscuta epithymum]CAH9135445.1 unnamed protein product [Cuscuta epithymum]